MNKDSALLSLIPIIWKFDENNSLRQRKDLINRLKLNVKTLMEYASVCRSIPEDSTHVIHFCELVHESLRIGLKTPPFLFYQNISTYSLIIHKISNQCEAALKVINEFEKDFNNIENLNNTNNTQFNCRQQQSNILNKNEYKLNFKKLFHSLDNNNKKSKNFHVNDQICKKSSSLKKFCPKLREFYNSDSIIGNKCDMNVFLSLISGPCAINYSSPIHEESYWVNLHADELIERQRFTSITNHNKIMSRSSLQVREKNKSPSVFIGNFKEKTEKTLKRIRNSSSLSDSSFTDTSVDSLYQTKKSTLLYGKNNVMLGDNQHSFGYFELISSTNDILLKWTSNNLLLQASNDKSCHCSNDKDGDDDKYHVNECILNKSTCELNNPRGIRDKCATAQHSQLIKTANKRVDNDFQFDIFTVSMNKMEYVHLHQDKSSEYCIILIGSDGIPNPPIRLFGGFNAVYNFLLCLDQGLQPNGCLNPSPADLNEVFEKTEIQSIQRPNENQQIKSKLWNFIDFRSRKTESNEICKQLTDIKCKNRDDNDVENNTDKTNLTQLDNEQKNKTCSQDKMNELKTSSSSPSSTVCTEKFKNIETKGVIFKITRYEIANNKNHDVFMEQDNKHIQDQLSMEPTNNNELKQTTDEQNDQTSHKEEFINSMDIVVTIKLQLLLRTFKAWLTYTRHMNNVRKLLSSLVIHSDRNYTSSLDRHEKLTREKWNELFVNIPDKQNFDPRCIYECIYYGGCESELRNEVWPYLLGVYDWTMNKEEKNTIDEQFKVHYYEKLKEWTKIEAIIHELEQNENAHTTLSSQMNYSQLMNNSSRDSTSCLNKCKESILKQFEYTLDSVKKDVVRCDRNNCFYSKFDSQGDRNLAIIQRILLTYVWEFLDDEYTQGMCDIVAPLLVLKLENSTLPTSSSIHLNNNNNNNNNNNKHSDTPPTSLITNEIPLTIEQNHDHLKKKLNEIEISTYILFKYMMENHFKKLFDKETATYYMDQKFDQIKSLIQILDPQLIGHLQQFSDFTQFYFCYRWFLLDFKREFKYQDIFQIWEVILCANRIISKDFSLFIALALIQHYRDVISSNHMELTDILKFFNERAEHHNVEDILNLARYFADTVQKLTSKTNNNNNNQ
ncbi:unnamed protein product [Schistosoma turkestanicum]|nr:unnamed protein product [Schistosoma turkestanicum]